MMMIGSYWWYWWLLACLLDWLIDWWIDWFRIVWLTVWLIDWLIDRLINWFNDWLLIDCLVDWFSTGSRPWDRGGGGGLPVSRPKKFFWPFGLRFALKIRGESVPRPLAWIRHSDWLVAWLVGWLNDWLIDWLIGWSIGWLRWLVDWLTYCWLTGYVGWLVDKLIDWLIQLVLVLNRHTDIRRKGHFRFIKRMRRQTKLL